MVQQHANMPQWLAVMNWCERKDNLPEHISVCHRCCSSRCLGIRDLFALLLGLLISPWAMTQAALA